VTNGRVASAVWIRWTQVWYGSSSEGDSLKVHHATHSDMQFKTYELAGCHWLAAPVILSTQRLRSWGLWFKASLGK
jgi:hypothetical protein